MGLEFEFGFGLGSVVSGNSKADEQRLHELCGAMDPNLNSHP